MAAIDARLYRAARRPRHYLRRRTRARKPIAETQHFPAAIARAALFRAKMASALASTKAVAAAVAGSKCSRANVLLAAPLRARAGRQAVRVSAAVKFDYNTKVFEKELVE